MKICSQFQVGTDSLDVLKQLVRVLADEGLGVVAGNVMPFHPVAVDVVEQAHAGLHGPVDVELGVVGLAHVPRLKLGLVAGVGPRLVAPAGWCGVGGSHLDTGPRPEPSVHCWGLQILVVATLEVAQPAGAPDVGKVVLDEEVLVQLVLGGRLEGHQVHAVLPADVPPVQPVNFVVSEVFFITREPAVVSAVLKMPWPLGTLDALQCYAAIIVFLSKISTCMRHIQSLSLCCASDCDLRKSFLR